MASQRPRWRDDLEARLLAAAERSRDPAAYRAVVDDFLDDLATQFTGAVVEQFSALISHEIRTPLTVIRGHADIALHALPDGDGELAASLRAIARNVDLAFGLLERFASVRSIERGDLRLQQEPVDLVALTEETLRDLQDSLLALRPLTVSTASRPLTVSVDPVLIRQLLFNVAAYCHGAARARTPLEVHTDSGPGLVRLTVEYRAGTPAGTHPEDHLRSLTRLDAEQQAGAVGLYVAHGIALAHGGAISTHRDGETATLVVTLPYGGPDR